MPVGKWRGRDKGVKTNLSDTVKNRELFFVYTLNTLFPVQRPHRQGCSTILLAYTHVTLQGVRERWGMAMESGYYCCGDDAHAGGHDGGSTMNRNSCSQRVVWKVTSKGRR